MACRFAHLNGCCQQSKEEKISHNRLLINMTIQSVQQIRRRPTENKTAKATQPKSFAYHGPRTIEGVV